MASRSLNKVLLIGNLTRDPELRYTPQGNAVSTFGVATNRQWTTDQGEKKEDVEFHTVVCWNKLAEIVSQFLKKGSQAYVEGRLSTREWEGQDNVKRRTTEVVANEVIFLGGTRRTDEALDVPADLGKSEAQVEDTPAVENAAPPEEKVPAAEEKQSKVKEETKKTEDDIPF